MNTSPTLVTPNIGVATATSVNGTTIPTSKTLVATDSTTYVVPSQTGNANKFLTTDGTTSSWGNVAGALAQPTEPSSPQDGQIWIDTDGTAPTTVVTRWTEQPAAGTTVLTGNDDYSIPLAYSPGYEQVFLNGVLLSRSGSEYTATNGTSITLAAATVAGDIVEVICPLQIATTDTYTQSAVNNAFQANTNNFAAGKNKIINGDFGIWQRGTSFSNPANATYTADRWFVELDGTSFTRTISQQTFTPGTAPIAGYEGTYFLRWNTSVAGTSNTIQALSTRLEDIRTLAGQTVTLSFWAKADASRALTVYAYQQSTGGSGTVTTTVGSATLTTSWARYTMTVALPSMAGVTIGTNSNLQIRIAMPTGVTMTCDFWGMQLEAGSNATAFQTATGTIQGELAACQRYYFRVNGNGSYNPVGFGYSDSTTVARMYVTTPPMRVLPTSIDYTNLSIVADAIYNSTGASIGASSPNMVRVDLTGLSGLTAFRSYALLLQNTANQFLGFSSEL